MSGPSGVPRQRTFEPTPSGRVQRRPAPRGRALLLALGTLAAPALAVLALTAFGSLSDEPESGLGSLPAAEGLQGSTEATPPPRPSDEPAGAKGGNSEFTSEADFEERAERDGDGSEPARPVLAGCPGGGPRVESSKRRVAPSSRRAHSEACGGAGDRPRTVDGDVEPGGGTPGLQPESVEPPQPPSGGYEDDGDDPDGSDDDSSGP